MADDPDSPGRSPPGRAGASAGIRASARAYEEIRALIFSGDLPPGSQLTEEALGERVGVSRTPVREALRRLEAELFVTRGRGGRLAVADWSRDDLAELFALRAMLEGHAAARAATRIGPEALGALAACNAEMKAAIDRRPDEGGPDVAAFIAANRRFHALVIEAAASRRLAAMLDSLVDQSLVRRTAIRYSAEDLAQSAAEHDQLVHALSQQDAEWARAVMVGHIRRAFHSLSPPLRRDP